MTSFRSALVVSLLLAACTDPAKGKTKAVTGAPEQQAVALAASAKPFAIDPATSKVEWVGSKVTGKHEGGFKRFQGVANVGESIEQSSVTVDIETESLFTDADDLADHLRSPDFFDVAKFPKATFASTEIKKGAQDGVYSLTGNLTLHGVTKAISFPATIRRTDASLEVDSEFAINRKDFGILYPGKQDDLIRDDVVIKLTIRAAKK